MKAPHPSLASDALRGRNLTGITDLTADELRLVLEAAAWLKENRAEQRCAWRPFTGRTLATIFEKPSLRTRVTFDVAMAELGGGSIYLAPSDIQLGKRESVPDVARNLCRWVDGVTARTFSHQTVLDLAANSTVPVINSLSDLEHPCQALADIQTVAERKLAGRPDGFRGLRLTFVGDGNNVANSLFLVCGLLGMDMTLACPPGYEADAGLLQTARTYASATGAQLQVTHDPFEGADGADVVYTDVWTSMGQEDEAAVRREAFRGFQVNAALLARARPDAIVLHCLPAHREEEITSEVLDGPQSAVLDQAENRLHAQKALLALML